MARLILNLLFVTLFIMPTAYGYGRLSNSRTRELVSELESASGSRRREIIRDLRGADNTIAYTALRDLAKEGDTSAINALGEYVTRYSQSSGRARSREIAEISVNALLSSDREMRKAGFNNMISLQVRDWETTTGQPLLERLQDEENPLDGAIERDVVRALGTLEYSEATSEIVKRLDPNNREMSSIAIRALDGMSASKNNEIRGALVELATSTNNNRLREEAFRGLSTRAQSYGGRDRQVAPALLSIFNNDESSNALKADALKAMGATDDSRLRSTIVENINSSNPLFAVAAIKAAREGHSYYEHRSVVLPLAQALRSSNTDVRKEAVGAMDWILDRQWKDLGRSTRREILQSLAHALKSNNSYDRRRAAELMAEYLHPYLQSQKAEGMREAIVRCLGYNVTDETITSDELRETATVMGIFMPIFLGYAMFGKIDDHNYQNFDVENVNQWDDEDVAAFGSIIEQLIS